MTSGGPSRDPGGSGSGSGGGVVVVVGVERWLGGDEPPIAKLRVVVMVVVVAHTTPQLKVQSVPEHHPRIEH